MRKPLFALATVAVALALWAGCKSAQSSEPVVPPLPPLPSASALKPGPNDPAIAFWTAKLLENYHYLQAPLDTEMSEKFFDGYINSLDPRHEFFLQSDMAEFASFRTNLDKLTVGGRGPASDLTPAFLIYQRWLERFNQHAVYVNELLTQDKFKFNTDEKIMLDRRHEPFPKDMAEAEQLWREHVRFDYLQEKLARELTETNGTFTVKLPSDAPTNIIASLAKHARWSLRMMTNLDSDTVLQYYLEALAHAYDPHSDYMNAPHAQDFSINMNLSLFGIGASLNEDDGYCTIRSLLPGGPAAASKELKEGDRIVKVAQGSQAPVDVVDMDLEKVVQLIRGPKGTPVWLTISPKNDRAARKPVKLVRDEIKLEDAAAKAKLIEMPDDHSGSNRLGIIDLPSFYAPIDSSGSSGNSYCSADVAKLVKKLKQENVSGILIDMRMNPGGSLEEAIKLTGLFIKDGPIVQARNPDGRVIRKDDPDPTQLYDGPLVVMINRYSASAAEIAAAALQDYGRALIVGDSSTHGKGTVQNLNQLKPFLLNSNIRATNDPGMVKITISKFYRVSGASTQIRGVVPDIILPDALNYDKQIGEASLDNPLPYDTIQPANYTKFNLVQPYLAQLKARSDARVATNQDFTYVRQDIEEYLKTQADNSATLNERAAIKEKERIASQNIAREKERADRRPSGVKVYEITVKNADEPGLVEYKPENDAMETVTTLFKTMGTNQINTIIASLDHGTTNSVGTNVTITGTGGAATNAVTNVVAAKKTAPPFDPMLDETEQILIDYINALSKRSALTANP